MRDKPPTTIHRGWGDLGPEWAEATCLFEHQCLGDVLCLVEFVGRAPTQPSLRREVHVCFLVVLTSHDAYRYAHEVGCWFRSWEFYSYTLESGRHRVERRFGRRWTQHWVAPDLRDQIVGVTDATPMTLPDAERLPARPQ